MAYSVHLTQRARADVDALAAQRARQDPEKASAWYAGLMDAILSLDTFPARCPRIPEAEITRPVRQKLYGRRPAVYRILFEVREETVYVLHVRHGAQAPVRPEDLDEGAGEEP